MKKEATDFALLASAFAADDQMARQVCKLLADGDVNETVARKMLGLVRDGKLQSPAPCTWPHYWYHTIPASPNWSYTTSGTSNVMYASNNGSLTELASEVAA